MPASPGSRALRWFRAALLLAAALSGCAPAAEKQSVSPSGEDTGVATDSTANARGFGPVRAGMTLAEAEQALGAPLVLLGPRMEPCHYVRIQDRPGVAFMVIEGRIARVDVESPGTVSTVEGAAIGDPEERIHALYPGRVEVQPHKYVDGHYLVVTPAAPADSSHRIIFETDGRRVTSFRTGRLPEVRWVEGCS